LGIRIAVLVLAAAGWVSAAELRPETRAAFDRYVRQAESRIDAKVRGGDGFLFATSAERRAVLRGGTVLSEAKAPRGEFKVAGGLIHDWAAATPPSLPKEMPVRRRGTIARRCAWAATRCRPPMRGCCWRAR
jgi:hypothetical protein